MSNNSDTGVGCVTIIVLIFFASMVFSGGGSESPDDFSLKYTGRQRLEATLKDPGSLEIIEERLVRPGRNGSKVGYYAKFRAKNSFGGYTVDEFYTE